MSFFSLWSLKEECVGFAILALWVLGVTLCRNPMLVQEEYFHLLDKWMSDLLGSWPQQPYFSTRSCTYSQKDRVLFIRL